MIHINLCRSQTRQRFPDMESQTNNRTPLGGHHEDEDAAKRVDCSMAQYELTFSNIADNTDAKNSDYAGLNKEHEYSNTSHVYSDLK